MYEVGQLVQIRERTWEVIEDRIAGSGGDHLLSVRGVEREIRGVEQVFIYRPGPDNGTSPLLERIVPLPSPELTWNPRTLPSRWERLHTAYRLSVAHNQDILAGLTRARVTVEPYQLDPVLRVMTAPRQRFLLAEDVGMGKTIEAGLIMMELIARGRADRILIVVPAALQDQWQDEMFDKFGLEFMVLDSDKLAKDVLPNLPPGANPWTYKHRVITSIDFAKQERIFRALKKTTWDLIVFDEAHYLSESGNEQKPIRTDRSRFGEEMAKLCDSLLLLTATPHNGYAQGFYSLLRLLDDARFPSPHDLRREAIDEVVIRRVKKQILDENDKPRFQTRKIDHVNLSLESSKMRLERKLYHELTKYGNKLWKEARGDSNQRLTVGFAMTLLKKRFISSPEAIRKSLDARKENLDKDPLDRKSKLFVAYRKGVPLTESQQKRLNAMLEAQTTARGKEAIEQEKQRIDELLTLAQQITPDQDYKAACLKAKLDAFALEAPPRRAIVFTEYKDTLDYLQKYLEERGYKDRLVVLHGEMNRAQRMAAEQRFHDEQTLVMLATDAASEGLNFQRGCWTIIHYELPWNPNRLEQRNGRVDRWGQTRTVEIYNMVLDGTLENRILQRLTEKLDMIRKHLKAASDVLSIAEAIDLETLDTRLMDAALEMGDDADQQEIEATAEAFGQDLDAQLDTAEQKLQEWLAQLSMAPGDFGQDDYKKIAEIRAKTDKALPPDQALEEFAISTLQALGGTATPVENQEYVWTLEIPGSLRREKVKERYERATFVSKVAQDNALERSASPRYIDYISVGHPLLEGLIAAVKIDAREGGPLAGRMAIRVLNDATRGFLFTFLGRWQDQRGTIVAEEIIPFFLPLDQPPPSAASAYETAQHLLALQPLRKNAPAQLLEEVYQPHWQAYSANVKEIAQVYCQNYAQQVHQQRLSKLAILENDLQIWAQARLTWVEQQLEKRKQEEVQAIQLSFDDIHRPRALAGAETRRKNDLEREKKSIENRVAERKDEIEQMKHIISVHPEMIGALIIVLAEEC